VNRVEVERGGAHAVQAVVGGIGVQRLHFPAAHRIPWFEPDHGYIAVVLDGTMQKRFSTATWSLSRGSFVTLPAGAGHSTDFGVAPTSVLAIYPCSDESTPLFGRFLRQRSRMTASAATVLGRRLAAELDAVDGSWGLAAEGLVLQLLAMGERETSTTPRRATEWLSVVAEFLHEQTPSAPSLSELSAAAGVHPGHLARAFRRKYGVTVCQYSRMLRVEWAAARLADDTPLARVALEAGFADQSHFTRAFRQHTGVTPGHYRKLLRDS